MRKNISYISGYRKYCEKCRWDVKKTQLHRYNEKCSKITRQDKYWILDEFNNECLHCKSKEKLELHHIKYGNNPIIIVLCKECHTKAHL